MKPGKLLSAMLFVTLTTSLVQAQVTRAVCDDGLACTTDLYNNVTATCDYTIDAGSCLIGGVCYNDGNLSLGNDCLACDPAADNIGFTILADGTPCTDHSAPCLGGGVCQGGTCTPVPADFGRPYDNGSFSSDTAYLASADGGAQAGSTLAARGGTCILIDFEGFGEDQAIGTITGTPDVRFDSSWRTTIDRDDGGSSNHANEPSPPTVAVHVNGFPDGVIDFDAGVYSVDVFYTASASTLPITLTAWDCAGGTGNVVDVAVGNTVGTSFDGAPCVGDPTGLWCLWDSLQVLSNDDNIRSVVISTGIDDLFSIDDMTICSNDLTPGVTSGNHFEWVRSQPWELQSDGVWWGAVYTSIAVDDAGSSYAVGCFIGTVTLGPDTLTGTSLCDTVVAKYDPAGIVQWATSAEGDFDWNQQVAIDDAGNIYVTGRFQGTASFDTFTLPGMGDNWFVFVVKYDAAGNVIWVQSTDVTYSGETDIAVDSGGNIYIAGKFYGTAIFGEITLTSVGSYDNFVVKYDTAGNVVWARSTGGSNSVRGMAIDSAGNIYLTGFFSWTTDFGKYTLTSLGKLDMFVVKYDAGGDVLWARSAGGGYYDFGADIAVDATGNSYVTGSFFRTATFGPLSASSKGDSDVFVAKYDTDGNILWVQSGGDWDADSGTSIAVDHAGNSYVTGTFSRISSFGPFTLIGQEGRHIFLAKYDADGNILWAQAPGGRSVDTGTVVAVDGAGNSYVAGFVTDTAAFGPFTIPLGGFVAKTHSDCPPEGCVCANYCGDINGRQTCANANGSNTDLVDYAMFANCFGLPPNHSQDCFCSDLNGDGTIDELDFAILVGLFESTSGNTPPTCP